MLSPECVHKLALSAVLNQVEVWKNLKSLRQMLLHKISQELRILSRVNLNCQKIMIVTNLGSKLFEMSTLSHMSLPLSDETF